MNGIRWARALQIAACFGALLFSPSSSAAVSLNTDAWACTTPNGGGGVVCTFDNTAPTGNVSRTSSGTNSTGVPFTSNASAFTDGSNFGELRMSGSAAITGAGEAHGFGQIIINDFHNFSAAGLSGQAGLATAKVLVAGSLLTSNNVTSAFDGQATAGWRYFYAEPPSNATLIDLYHSETQMDSDWWSYNCSINLSFTACANTYGLFSFDIPFIWGVDDPFNIQFTASAQSVGIRDFVNASASYDLANSILWGGLSNVRANGIPVADYDYRSGSGYDWRMSSIAQNPVPEPATLALFGIGLAGLAASRRRSQ